MNYITWLYFLEDKENYKDIFLYGLSLPTQNSKCSTKTKSIKINNKKRIVLFTTISNLTILQDEELNFSGFMGKAKYKTNIIDTQSTILVSKEIGKNRPYSFLEYPIYTKTFYTEDIQNYIYSHTTIEELNIILNKLSNISGQAFNDIYSKRLGCYEIGNISKWIENKNIQFIKCKLDKKNNKREYWFEKDLDINIDFTVHLIIYNDDNEILYDFIDKISQEINSKKLIITTLDEDAGFEYWIFDNENNLLDERNLHFVKNISSSIHIVEGEYKIPKDTFSKKNPLSQEDSEVQVYTPSSHQVFNNTKQSNIKVLNQKLYQQLKEYNQKDDIKKYGKWFKKDNFKELIDFFNELTKDGNYELIFIDPFISSSACLDYLYHFKNTNITFNFISCWAYNISPDDDTKQETVLEHIEKFKQILENIKEYKLSLKNSTWYNLKEKSFHDRYLYINNLSTKEVLIFSLSNSLNNLLSNYENLLILPLHGIPYIEAKNYIENDLLSKCNESNKIYPEKD